MRNGDWLGSGADVPVPFAVAHDANDPAGAIVAKYEYDPYGQRINYDPQVPEYDQPWRFSTKQFDAETGLGYWGYRYYSPGLGRWISRDPIGERGDSALCRYCGNRSPSAVDPLGLQHDPASQPCCHYCGPDVTEFLLHLINNAITNLRKSRLAGTWWLFEHGEQLDWARAFTIRDDDTGDALCPSGSECQNTYWLCGECVHNHWIGNFMYGFIGRLFRLPDWEVNWGAKWAQHLGTPGKDDPPWDTAGYGIARRLFDRLKEDPQAALRPGELCELLKEDSALWARANDTSVSSSKYPEPHARGYKACEKCPYALPKDLSTTVPGGSFGNAWP